MLILLPSEVAFITYINLVLSHFHVSLAHNSQLLVDTYLNCLTNAWDPRCKCIDDIHTVCPSALQTIVKAIEPFLK